MPRSRLARRLRLAPARLEQGNIGAPGVLTAAAPFGCAVPDQHHPARSCDVGHQKRARCATRASIHPRGMSGTYRCCNRSDSGEEHPG